jgi:hypothetical protein
VGVLERFVQQKPLAVSCDLRLGRFLRLSVGEKNERLFLSTLRVGARLEADVVPYVNGCRCFESAAAGRPLVLEE